MLNNVPKRIEKMMRFGLISNKVSGEKVVCLNCAMAKWSMKKLAMKEVEAPIKLPNRPVNPASISISFLM